MPRQSAPSTHLIARVRAWFGLTHAELGLYLGVSKALLQAIETGRRQLTPAVAVPLLPLLQLVPQEGPANTTAAPALPPALPAGTPLPDAGELYFRRRECLGQAARLRQELGKLTARAEAARHWAEALPRLLPAPDAAPPTNPDEAAREAWRAGWVHRRARPLPPEDVTRWYRLRARLAGLLAEEAALDGIAAAWRSF
ncbi:hypothetical protein GCM10023185_35420 [Hymenobacter saemangeumensis]|uniref:HTH cro/C1-type domain-containing protein n=1 Tax=Hymenobacter saemangeumensis TaxID=1084522 RepID=A0ABP8IPJ6_9BACT